MNVDLDVLLTRVALRSVGTLGLGNHHERLIQQARAHVEHLAHHGEPEQWLALALIAFEGAMRERAWGMPSSSWDELSCAMTTRLVNMEAEWERKARLGPIEPAWADHDEARAKFSGLNHAGMAG